jgi:hypothetical protein
MPVDPLDAPLTSAEILELRRYIPDATRIDDQGRIIPLRSRRELAMLELRFGSSMDPRRVPPPVRTGDAARDVLAARYPTMFRGSKP